MHSQSSDEVKADLRFVSRICSMARGSSVTSQTLHVHVLDIWTIIADNFGGSERAQLL
jgi:hypothetical protein